MAYVVDYALTSAAAAAASTAANMPPHQTNDILVMFVTMNAGALTTTSTGWAAISTNNTNTANTSSFTWKRATSSAETFTFSTADDYSMVIISIRDVDTTTALDVAAVHDGLTATTTAPVSPGLTTSANGANSLILYFMGLSGVANAVHSPPGVHHIISFDNGGTNDTNSATCAAAAWYIERNANTAVPTPTWTASVTGTQTRLTIALRNATNGRIPAYIDDVSTPANRLVLGTHIGTNVNNVSFAALSPTTAINGKTLNSVAAALQADLGINPFSSGTAIAAAVVPITQLSGYQVNFTNPTTRDLSTGLVMGSAIGATPKMGTYGMGSVSEGGYVVRIGSAAGAWVAYQVGARDSVPTLEERSVWAIEAGYTGTSYGTPGTTVTTNSISFLQFLQNSPQTGFNSHAILSEVYQVLTLVVAGGDATYPVDSEGLASVGKSFRLPVIKRLGAGLLSYAPIKIGGGDRVNFQISAGSLQFPKRYDATTKEISFHASDNKVGIIYDGRAGDVIKHTNSTVSSQTPFYWIIAATASSSATWDFSGMSIVGSGDVELRPVTTFIDMNFTKCSLIDTSGCTLTGCAFTQTVANSLTMSSTTSITNASFDTSTIAAGSGLTTVTLATRTAGGALPISDSTFTGTSTSGHAIIITEAGTYSFSGLTFTGYGGTPGDNNTASSGSTSAAVYNNSGGVVIIQVSGGTQPSVRNGAGATTDVQASADVIIDGLVAGSEVRAYTGTDPATAVEIAGTENSTGTSFTFTQSSAGIQGYIHIFHLEYQPIFRSLTYSGSNQTITVQQIKDRQFDAGSVP